MQKKKISILFCLITIISFSQENGGFEKIPHEEQETGPGMILIEGGIFDLTGSGKAKDTLQPFYISATEESNAQYCEYLKWIRNCYSEATYRNALPDTTVWLGENFPDTTKNLLVKHYLRSESFKNYPVVGVSPQQILKYAEWKTDRMNEMILIREDLLDFVYYPTDSSGIFVTEAYLSGKWQGRLKQTLPSFDSQIPGRDVRMEDGIFLPRLRLPSENEWKAAALAIGDKTYAYVKTPKELGNYKNFDKKNYFWYLYPKEKKKKRKVVSPGFLLLQDVDAGTSNNYLIYNFSGNVSELVISSDGKYVIGGGSWKFPGPDLSARYDPIRSTYNAVSFPVFPEGRSSATNGFRLAMDHAGDIVHKKKKRKGSKRSS